jgi:hypothetical protein
MYQDWTSSHKFLGIYQAESRSEAHPSSLLHDMMFRLIYHLSAISALSHHQPQPQLACPLHLALAGLSLVSFANVRAKSAALTSF